MFGQGTFQIDPNLTPEEVKARREKLARSAPRYGQARYVGQGLAHLGTGIADMIASRRLNKAERAGRESADATMARIEGGGMNFPMQFGGGYEAGPNQDIADDAMAATGNQPRGRDDFIASLWPHAMRVSEETGLDPRLVVAQAAQETGWGKSAPGNNYFGIKSHGQDGGNVMQTNEVIDGETVRIPQSFRGYEDMGASVDGYSQFLQDNPRYEAMLSAGDLDGQLEALGNSGYATDPNYASSVGSIAKSIQPPQGQQYATNTSTQSDVTPLYEALNNPWLTQQQRTSVQRMIAKLEKENDPLRQLQIEKAGLDIDALRNPKSDLKIVELADGRTYYIDPKGVEPPRLVNPNLGKGDVPSDVDPMDMRKEFSGLKSVKDFSSQKDAYGRIIASSDNPSPAGDMALIFNYMKMLDPGSVVRESEFDLAASTGGYGERIKAAWKTAKNGEKLTESQRADFVKRSEKLYQQAEKQFEGLYNQYASRAEAAGLSPEDAINDFRFIGNAPDASSRPKLRNSPIGDGWTVIDGVRVREKK